MNPHLPEGNTFMSQPDTARGGDTVHYPIHLYYSLIPAALIASQLTPEQFGQYYATGYGYRSKGQALFFEVDPGFRHDYFEIDKAYAECVAHPDGRPKNSVYVSTYRVLEHMPVSALGTLYLVTPYGATLGLDRSTAELPSDSGLHLYRELDPVSSLVASSQNPRDFYEGITIKPSKLVKFPGLAFVELAIGELASNPEHGHIIDLPYDNLVHLRESLAAVGQPGKNTKIVERVQSAQFQYRSVKQGSGFFFGNGTEMAYYPMPSHSYLRENHPLWWRSANQ